MKVIVELDVADQERELITRFYRKRDGATGLPKLATRKLIKEFVEQAMLNEYSMAKDVVEHKVA